MTDKETLKLALEALELYGNRHRATYLLDGAWDEEITVGDQAIAALKERLADPMRETQRLGQEIEQEPVCPDCKAKVLYECVACSSNNYPPQRKPLTDKAITKVIDSMPRGINGWMSDWDLYEFARAIEARLKEKT
jgi:hypothetical protein